MKKEPKKAAYPSVEDAKNSPLENGKLFQITFCNEATLYMRAKTAAEAAYVALRKAGGKVSCIQRQLAVLQPEVIVSACMNMAPADQRAVVRRLIDACSASEKEDMVNAIKAGLL